MIESMIVGVSTGVIASLAAWWFLYHFMAPKIEFGEKIKKEKTANTSTGWYYQFKVGNMKKRTSAIDLDVRATVYFPNFPSIEVTNLYSIPIDGKHIFELTPKQKGSTAWNRRISLNINDDDFVKIFEKTYFSDRVKSLAKDKMLLLEDVLSITDNAMIRLHVLAMDSYSGSKKVFRSKPFRFADIAIGKYEKGSLKFIAERT